MNMAWIICRANDNIGLGHLIRCLNISDCLHHEGVVTSVFVLSESSLKLPANFSSLDVKFVSERVLTACLETLPPDEPVILDLDDLEESTVNKLEAMANPVISLSPIFRKNLVVDMYIGRIVPEYPLPEDASSMVSPEYAIFNSDIEKVATSDFLTSLESDRLRVSMVFGGGRKLERYREILESIYQLAPSIHLDIYSGSLGGCSQDDLDSLCLSSGFDSYSVKSFKSPQVMWSEIGHNSLILCEGGLVAYEAAYCGIPFIALIKKAYQMSGVRYLLDCGAGLLVDERYQELSHLSRILESYVLGREKLATIHRNSRNVMMRAGGQHVTESIIQFYESRSIPFEVSREVESCLN